LSTSNDLHVVFGSGAVGLSVIRELHRRGRRVRVVNGCGTLPVPVDVEIVASDAYDPNNTKRVSEGAAVVYQCAQPGYSEWPEKFPALQASILEGAAANRARLIIADNLYMYGPVNGPIREDLPYNAQGRKGKTRAMMAEAALAAHRDGKVKVALGRASDFYGPHGVNSAMGEMVFRPVLSGKKPQVFGKIDEPHTYSFIDDFGKGLVTLGEHDKALGQTWHIPNAETVSTRQFVNMIYAEASQARLNTTAWGR